MLFLSFKIEAIYENQANSTEKERTLLKKTQNFFAMQTVYFQEQMHWKNISNINKMWSGRK